MRPAFRTHLACIALLAVFAGAAASTPQRRDYLTDAELNLVRDNQQVDLRVAVLVRAAQRRIEIIRFGRLTRKEPSEWGEAPTGEPSLLLRDIDGLIGKAISDIDDAAERKVSGPEFAAAVHALADFCGEDVRSLALVPSERFTDRRSGAVISSVEEQCVDVAAAAAKVPRPARTRKSKSKNKND
jgi:hypothetical protein